MIALIMGFVIPIIYILGKDYLNDKIQERKDIENITKLPIVGHILNNNRDSNLVVHEAPKSSIAESFRSIRTNIQYLTQGKEKQCILITSAMVGAGKTFASINLASIFAQYDKKNSLTWF